MTLAFPRVMPFSKFSEATITPVRRQATGATESGSDVVIDRGVCDWRGKWKTNSLSSDEFGKWRAFFASLRSSERFFLGWDPFREYPLNYMPGGAALPTTRAGGGAFDWTCSLATISTGTTARDTVALYNLPAAFVLSPSDYVSFAEGSRVSLHTVIEATAVAADGSGNLTVQIEPELPPFLDTAAAVTLWRASAKWRLVAAPPMTARADGGLRPGDVEFEALSTLK